MGRRKKWGCNGNEWSIKKGKEKKTIKDITAFSFFFEAQQKK